MLYLLMDGSAVLGGYAYYTKQLSIKNADEAVDSVVAEIEDMLQRRCGYIKAQKDAVFKDLTFDEVKALPLILTDNTPKPMKVWFDNGWMMYGEEKIERTERFGWRTYENEGQKYLQCFMNGRLERTFYVF